MLNECNPGGFYQGPKRRVVYLGEVSSPAELVERGPGKRSPTLTEQRRARMGRLEALQEGYGRRDARSGGK